MNRPARTPLTCHATRSCGARTQALLRCMPVLLRAAALAPLVLMAACTALLPSTRTEVQSQWSSYNEGLKSLAAITPYQATRADVHREGLDPHANPGITVLHFADVLQRFSAAALIKPQDVDPGIRDCLQAGQRCSGYAVLVKKVKSDRIGNFWLDSLNFKRETINQGWSIDALLVFVDDQLVYELIGGQPTINDYEVRSNPLGPLLGWGNESLRAMR